MTQRLMWILWPAFLMAGIAEIVFFSLVDPSDLTLFGEPIELSRRAIYSIGFFVFWALAAGSSAMTCMLARSPFEVNRCPLPSAERPDGCPRREDGSCGP